MPIAPVKTKKIVWPSQRSIESAIIVYLAEQGGEVVFKGDARKTMLNALADHFTISRRQRKLPHPTAGTKWSNKVQWAKLGLSRSGKLTTGARSTWVLDSGLLALVRFIRDVA